MSKIDLRLLLQNKLIANTNVPAPSDDALPTDPSPHHVAKPAPRREPAPRMAPPVRPHPGQNRALRPRRRS